MNKTMEKEYKWRADELLLNRALLWASSRIGSQSRTIRMESSYFDTADGMLRNKKAALRLRRENERTVCCMKLRGEEERTDGLRAHEEYQCDAGTLEDGLRQLPEKGAPEALCGELLHAELKEICTVSFRRCAVLLQEQDTVCELALDKGELCREGRSAPLCEIELEYVAGDEKAFHALAAELARPCPRERKQARAGHESLTCRGTAVPPASETVEKLRFSDNLCFDVAKHGRPKVPMRKLSPS